MPPRKRTNTKQVYALHDPSLSVLGISSYANPNTLAWQVNTQLGYHFAQAGSISKEIGTESRSFEVYIYEDEPSVTLYKLVNNRNAEGTLLPQFKNFDFILLIRGEYAESYATRFIQKMRRASEMVYVGIIPQQMLNRKFHQVLH